MAPEAWGGVGFVTSYGKQTGSEEIVGKNASLGQAITALANLKVDSPITIVSLEVGLLYKFCQNVSDFNAEILRVMHRSIKVEVIEFN